MNACTTSLPARSAPAATGIAPFAALAGWLHRFAAWRAARAQAARDRATLAQMSERELHDIGIASGFRDYAASGTWYRDDVR